MATMLVEPAFGAARRPERTARGIVQGMRGPRKVDRPGIEVARPSEAR